MFHRGRILTVTRRSPSSSVFLLFGVFLGGSGGRPEAVQPWRRGDGQRRRLGGEFAQRVVGLRGEMAERPRRSSFLGARLVGTQLVGIQLVGTRLIGTWLGSPGNYVFSRVDVVFYRIEAFCRRMDVF